MNEKMQELMRLKSRTVSKIKDPNSVLKGWTTVRANVKLSISTENLLLFLNLNTVEKYCKQSFELYSSAMGIKKWVLL